MTQPEKKPSQVLREAAKALDKKGLKYLRGCCGVLGEVAGKFDSEAFYLFEDLFRTSGHSYWFGWPESTDDTMGDNAYRDGEFIGATLEARKQHRVLSLLLCADIAESEGN